MHPSRRLAQSLRRAIAVVEALLQRSDAREAQPIEIVMPCLLLINVVTQPICLRGQNATAGSVVASFMSTEATAGVYGPLAAEVVGDLTQSECPGGCIVSQCRVL